MNVALTERQSTQDATLKIVDCDIHPAPRAISDLTAFMPARWVEHMKTFGSSTRTAFAKAGLYARYNRDGGSRFDTRPPSGGPSGSDLDFMRSHHLDPNNIEFGILQALRPSGISERNQAFGTVLNAAVNDWQAHHWCEPENRLKGSIMVTREDPEAAVKEIERWAGNPHFVQVSTLPHGLEPLGRQRYWPIFEAAEAHHLPIGIHVGGVSGMAPTNTGWPSFYIEEHHSKCEAMQALMVSMIVEGVFERFPNLRIVLIEGGFVWVPSLAWRLDKTYLRLRAEAPHLQRLPSNYIRDHFWYTTQPVEEPRPASDLADVMDWVGWDRILFSTDYPHWDYDDPRHAFKIAMTEQQKRQIFADNAKNLYRLA
jgi:uncharacterized protein